MLPSIDSNVSSLLFTLSANERHFCPPLWGRHSSLSLVSKWYLSNVWCLCMANLCVSRIFIKEKSTGDFQTKYHFLKLLLFQPALVLMTSFKLYNYRLSQLQFNCSYCLYADFIWVFFFLLLSLPSGAALFCSLGIKIKLKNYFMTQPYTSNI